MKLTAGSKVELLESVFDELVKWAMRRRQLSNMRQ
jgi:hypothetical protein